MYSFGPERLLLLYFRKKHWPAKTNEEVVRFDWVKTWRIRIKQIHRQKDDITAVFVISEGKILFISGRFT